MWEQTVAVRGKDWGEKPKLALMELLRLRKKEEQDGEE